MKQNNKKGFFYKTKGFSLIELLVVMAIVGILAGIVYTNLSAAQASARDESRKVALKEVQLALEFYKAQNGRYPAAGCGATSTTATNCYPYIEGLTPDFIPELPRDPNGQSYRYRTNTNGTGYKLSTLGNVERNLIQSCEDEFSRYPVGHSSCANLSSTLQKSYAVYGGTGSSGW